VKSLPALISILLATIALAPLALGAEDAAKAEYVARAEPICQANTEASQRILAGASDRVKAKKLKKAGSQFVRAATAFGKAIGEIAAIPRPAAEATRLGKWIAHLRLVEGYLRKTGEELMRGDRRQATVDFIKTRSAANAANNVIYNFEFHDCRITGAKFL
jgi:hypothetical protein